MHHSENDSCGKYLQGRIERYIRSIVKIPLAHIKMLLGVAKVTLCQAKMLLAYIKMPMRGIEMLLPYVKMTFCQIEVPLGCIKMLLECGKALSTLIKAFRQGAEQKK